MRGKLYALLTRNLNPNFENKQKKKKLHFYAQHDESIPSARQCIATKIRFNTNGIICKTYFEQKLAQSRSPVFSQKPKMVGFKSDPNTKHILQKCAWQLLRTFDWWENPWSTFCCHPDIVTPLSDFFFDQSENCRRDTPFSLPALHCKSMRDRTESAAHTPITS